MAKHITIGWEQFRVTDHSHKHLGMFYFQVRPLLFGLFPVSRWRTLYYFNDFQKAIETLSDLMQANVAKRNKGNVIEMELPSEII